MAERTLKPPVKVHGNQHLTCAKNKKDDEFYTREEDVALIVRSFARHLKGKRVYCNCDTDDSQFVKYLLAHKEEVEYESLEWSGMSFDDADNLERLDACDVVIANPPFSIYSYFLDVLDEHGKDFILVAPNMVFGNSYGLKRVLDGKMYPTRIKINRFSRPDKSTAQVACWVVSSFADMDLYEPPERPIKSRRTDTVGVQYDNYDAIECPRLEYLPILDQTRVIGVPITFMTSPLRKDYEIIKQTSNAMIDGKNVFNRLLIKRKQ